MRNIVQISNVKSSVFSAFVILCGFFLSVNIRAQVLTKNERSSLTERGYGIQTTDELPENPSLVDYEKAMLTGNPAVRAVYGEWQAEVKKITMVRGLPDPKINFGIFIQNIETAVGPQEYKIGIMQMIPWLGKLVVQGSIQTMKAEAAYQKLQGEIDGQLLKLRNLYYDAYYLDRAIDITRQNLDLVKNWEQVILTKYRTAMAQHANLVKTQIETIKLQDDLETLQAKQKPLVAAFGALLNRLDIDRIHVPDSLEYRPVAYSKEELISIVLENNPGLKRMHSMEQAAGKAVTRAKLNFVPDFSVGIDKIFTGDKWNAAGQPVPESGKDPLVVMGSVSIPLWFYKQSAGVGAAKHQERKVGSLVENKVNVLQAELESVWFALDDAARKIALYRDMLIPKSLESLRASEKAYTSGSIDFLNIIDGQRRYLQFQLASEHALVRYHKTLAKLEALAGRAL